MPRIPIQSASPAATGTVLGTNRALMLTPARGRVNHAASRPASSPSGCASVTTGNCARTSASSPRAPAAARGRPPPSPGTRSRRRSRARRRGSARPAPAAARRRTRARRCRSGRMAALLHAPAARDDPDRDPGRDRRVLPAGPAPVRHGRRSEGLSVAAHVIGLCALAGLPFGFLIGLVRARVLAGGRSARSWAARRLPRRRGAPGPARRRAARPLPPARLLGAGGRRPLRRRARAGGLPARGRRSRAWTPVEADGRPVAAIVHDAALRGTRRSCAGGRGRGAGAGERAPGGRAARPDRGAARLAGADHRRRATPSAGASSATSTTAPSSGSSRSRCSSAGPAQRAERPGRSGGAARPARTTSCGRRSPSCASWRGASTRPS